MLNARILAASIAVVALSFGTASAADVTIASATGKAFVDNGGGFSIAPQGTAVSAGSRVMAMAGDVVLSDASGCTLTVKPGDMLAVNGTALCASAVLPAANTSTKKNDDRTPAWVWVGGVLVAGGVAAAILSNNDSKKTSP